ncbi:unnamed protein product [Brassicogethes aeneus]|uniref:C3H1-type domain-containing protein n=1 Tax=Brassicogethes aeneus TaxID=1431903 RepID=A0A9P0FKD5_BRAAE|nr:unnamed protein product [Brassicogethes aeneus]
MSTAIMQTNAMYEFGDNLLKNGTESTTQSNHLAGSSMRLTLTRMASTPGTTASANLAMILGNLTQQHRRLERTQSAPAPPVTTPPASIASAAVNTSRYKTELCRPYEEFGVCKYGDKCQFAHGMSELRSLARHPKYKTELCRTYHTVGFCPYGPRCHFVHNQDEVAPCQKGPAVNQALLAARHQQQQQHRSRPSALSPSLSLDSPSPPCSLSQSPTSSMGSFFSSEPELHSPSLDDQRLPVFNRLSTTQLLQLSELML